MNEFTMSQVDGAGDGHPVIEIRFRGQQVCRIRRESGLDDLRVEFARDMPATLPLNDFEAVLRQARGSFEGAQLAIEQLKAVDA